MRPILRLAFGIVVLVWLLAEGAAFGHSQDIAKDAALIGDNALTSICLVQRMGMDVERRRILVDEHLFEKRPDVKQHIEQEIATTQADYARAVRQYDALSKRSTEAAAYGRLVRDVASVDEPITEALVLSRQNREDEARARIVEGAWSFAAIERDVNDLVEINRMRARRATSSIAELQRGATSFQLALTLAALLATLLLGVWMTRTVARHERQLRDDAEALERKNRELDAFAGRVAHDLRGPLSTVSMAASTVAREAPEVEEPVAALRRGVSRMGALIDDLLKLSRIGAASPNAVADAHAVAHAVEEDLRRRAQEIDAVLRLDVEPARVRCDDGLLREVIWNLCENALKYRREGVRAEIEVTGRAKTGLYDLRVADNGTGMSPEDARHAFEPFFRAKRTQSMGGTGLGLSIVQRIVEAHGGKIRVRSKEGEGTTFVVELALARERARDARSVAR